MGREANKKHLRNLRELKTVAALVLSSLPIFVMIIHFIYPSFFAIALDRWIFHTTEKLADEINVNGYAPIKKNKSGIPILVYHQIGEGPGEYKIKKKTFINHLKMLEHIGYNTISVKDLDGYLNHGKGLPKNPIFITFDDGARNAYVGADEALRLFGMKAAMFVIASRPGENSSYPLNWRELRAMKRSGRWDIQSHSYDGHGDIVIDKNRNTANFFGSVGYLKDRHRKETIKEYKKRVSLDLRKSIEEIEANIPDERVISFAYPFGDFGQEDELNSVKSALAECVKKYFSVAFMQSCSLNDKTTEHVRLCRLSIHGSPSAKELYENLSQLYR